MSPATTPDKMCVSVFETLIQTLRNTSIGGLEKQVYLKVKRKIFSFRHLPIREISVLRPFGSLGLLGWVCVVF